MTSPAFVQITLTNGTTANASDLQTMFSMIAGFLGNDNVTTDNITASNGTNILTSDGSELSINVPNSGGGHKFHLLIGGVHVMTVDSSGNVVFKGTVTASGSPS